MFPNNTLYNNSSNVSITNGRLPYNHRDETFLDVGIIIPADAAGEINTTCPRCSHNRRKSRDPCLSVNVTEGVWLCHHCGWKGGLPRQGYYQRRSARRVLPGSAAPQPTHPSLDAEAKAKADAERNRQRLREVWNQARSITVDDPAGRYLKRRGVWPTPVPRVLRYYPDLPYYYPKHEHRRPTKHPALIAAIQGPDERAVSLHRIYLTADGHKANVPTPKKFMSPTTTVMGAAIRLDPAADELVVTEGVETALAVRLMTGMPTWAALSTAGMINLLVPETVHLVVIAADHDAHGKGEMAAQSLAQRLLRENRTRTVKICKPETPGTDWADTLEIRYHG
jgi:putative DNA primase/helicase